MTTASDGTGRKKETASIVHELQAPLTVLRVRLEKALRASWCGPECRGTLEACLNDLGVATRITSDLLLMERTEGSQPPPQPLTIRLDALASKIARDYVLIAESRAVSLALDELEPVSVMAAAGDLERILANLLDNAFRHTPSGGTVRVRLERADDCAELRVIDTGPGIPYAHQRRVFERFYQVDRETDRAAGGVGLGLAVARSLAGCNGARLDLESTPGEGCTFILRVPTAASDR